MLLNRINNLPETPAGGVTPAFQLKIKLKKSDMKKVYKLNFEEAETLVILESDIFETMRLCECYNSAGQLIGCEDAGCYTLQNSYAESCLLRDLEAETGSDNITTPAAKEWLKENESHEVVTAYNYWDGHNNRTIILKADHDETDIDEVSNDVAAPILAALEKIDFVDYKGATCKVEQGGFLFVKTRYTSDPYYCTVETL